MAAQHGFNYPKGILAKSDYWTCPLSARLLAIDLWHGWQQTLRWEEMA